MPIARLRTLALALVGGLLAAPAALADRVELHNGRVFDDVVATVSGDRVEIRLGGGSLTLPRAQVRSITSAASTVEAYRARSADLRATADVGAADWLELARWAAARSFDFGTREAALAAADLEPRLDGLAPILRRLGYELDDASGRWLPADEVMRRRGFVEEGGVWVPAAVALARAEERREQEAARRRAAEAARLERLADLAELQLARATAAPPESVPAYAYGGWGAWGGPVFYPVPVPVPTPDPERGPFHLERQRRPARPPEFERHVVSRPPGSIIPIGGR